MLIKNTNNHSVMINLKNQKTFSVPALSELEIDEKEILSLPSGVIKTESDNLLIEPNLYEGLPLEDRNVDTTKLLLG